MRDGLKDIFWAEKALVRALARMSRSANSTELKEAFDNHRRETENQISLLERAFRALDMKPSGKRCAAMEGLIEEGSEMLEEYSSGPGRDAALIVSAQKVEHYEIAAYGSLRAFARALGETECEQVFEEILDQESRTDELLTQVALRINEEALAAHRESQGGQSDTSGRSNGQSTSSPRMESDTTEMEYSGSESQDTPRESDTSRGGFFS